MDRKIIIGYLFGSVSVGLLGIISLPILTWFFTAEDIGKISMLQVVSSLFVVLFCLGLDQAYVREYYEAKDKLLLFKMAFIPGFLLSTIVLLLLFILYPNSIAILLYDENSVNLSFLSIIYFLLMFLLRFFTLTIRMQERSFVFSISQILPKIFFLFLLTLVIYLKGIRNINSLLVMNLLSLFITCFIVLFFSRKYIKGLSCKGWEQEKFKNMLIFSAPLVIGSLASWALNTMDKLFLRGESTFLELGLYSVTFSIVSVVSIFSGVFNTIWSPLVYKWVSQGEVNLNKLNEIYENLLAIVFFIVVLSGITSWILPFFLPMQYYNIQYIVIPCLLCPLLYSLSEVSAVGIAIAKRTKFSMFASIGAMICNFIGNLYLVSKYGALGASISTSISFYLFYLLRSQFSNMVWLTLNQKKPYFIITFLLFLSIIHAFNVVDFYTMLSIWFLTFLIGIYLFKNIISNKFFSFLIYLIYKKS